MVIAQERDAERRLIVKAHNVDLMPSGAYTAISIVP